MSVRWNLSSLVIDFKVESTALALPRVMAGVIDVNIVALSNGAVVVAIVDTIAGAIRVAGAPATGLAVIRPLSVASRMVLAISLEELADAAEKVARCSAA